MRGGRSAAPRGQFSRPAPRNARAPGEGSGSGSGSGSSSGSGSGSGLRALNARARLGTKRCSNKRAPLAAPSRVARLVSPRTASRWHLQARDPAARGLRYVLPPARAPQAVRSWRWQRWRRRRWQWWRGGRGRHRSPQQAQRGRQEVLGRMWSGGRCLGTTRWHRRRRRRAQ